MKKYVLVDFNFNRIAETDNQDTVDMWIALFTRNSHNANKIYEYDYVNLTYNEYYTFEF